MTAGWTRCTPKVSAKRNWRSRGCGEVRQSEGAATPRSKTNGWQKARRLGSLAGLAWAKSERAGMHLVPGSPSSGFREGRARQRGAAGLAGALLPDRVAPRPKSGSPRKVRRKHKPRTPGTRAPRRVSQSPGIAPSGGEAAWSRRAPRLAAQGGCACSDRPATD
jgi:hypothetical protein